MKITNITFSTDILFIYVLLGHQPLKATILTQIINFPIVSTTKQLFKLIRISKIGILTNKIAGSIIMQPIQFILSYFLKKEYIP